MKEHGNVLLTGTEKEEIGILVFDVTSAPAGYVAENPELIANFLSVTAAANERWTSGAGGEEMLKVIAKEAGMDLEAARASIATMKFPSIDEQLSETWLGGNAQTFMKGVADVFVAAGSIDAAKASYVDNVNAGPLAAAK
jgi:taurine transport system substrate-binding protein